MVSEEKRLWTDSQDDLIEMYWIKGMTPTQIRYQLKYSTSKRIFDRLKEFNIPLRGIDTAKEFFEIIWQDGLSTKLRGAILDADGETVTTEAINVLNYRQFQAAVAFGETGTATDSTITVTAQFSPDNNTWFDYEEGAWTFPVESSATIPRNFIVTGICLYPYIRFVFEATEGTTLDATNYFTVNQLWLGVS